MIQPLFKVASLDFVRQHHVTFERLKDCCQSSVKDWRLHIYVKRTWQRHTFDWNQYTNTEMSSYNLYIPIFSTLDLKWYYDQKITWVQNIPWKNKDSSFLSLIRQDPCFLYTEWKDVFTVYSCCSIRLVSRVSRDLLHSILFDVTIGYI